MKKVSFTRFMLSVALVCLGVLAMLKFIYAPKQVRNQGTIEWLESSNDELYPEVKDEIKDIIFSDTGETPVKVAFKVSGGNYQSCTYDLDIWYKTEKGKWYWTGMSWIDKRISRDLDEKLMDIYRS